MNLSIIQNSITDGTINENENIYKPTKNCKNNQQNQRDLILNTKKILQLHDQRPTNRRIIIKRRNIHDHQP